MEFGVYSVEKDGDKLVLEGRVNLSEIKVGESFSLAYEVPVNEEDGALTAAGRINHKYVDLKITQIEAYGRLFDSLTEGMSARIVLTGDGMEHVKEGLTLGDG